MTSAIAFYYFKVRDIRWPEIQQKLQIEDKNLKNIKKQVLQWSKSCTEEELELFKSAKYEKIEL